MKPKLSEKEKRKRWEALQKTRMSERIQKHLPVFDGYPVRTPNARLRYGEKPDEGTYRV